MKASKADIKPVIAPELDPETDVRLAGAIALALLGSGFRARDRWPWVCVVLRAGEPTRVTSRADFSHWLRANDLVDKATEAMHRSVPRGSILVWLEADNADVATAGFFVFDLDAALRSARRLLP
jgi:hypothetical protein